MTLYKLEECTKELLENYNNHAFVFGRCKIWTHGSEFNFHYSKTCWWTAMYYSHKGLPSDTHAWGIYAGSSGYTGPGDAEITHFMLVPPPSSTPRDDD